MTASNRRKLSLSITIRPAITTALLTMTIFIFGCGGDSTPTTNTAKYPAGISEDVEQQLKYDSRVDSFETGEGDSLIINVNDSWVNSPPGMQERSLGQWYSMWHSAHSGAVIVQHQGNKIATWTSKEGYKPESKSKSDEPAPEG